MRVLKNMGLPLAGVGERGGGLTFLGKPSFREASDTPGFLIDQKYELSSSAM